MELKIEDLTEEDIDMDLLDTLRKFCSKGLKMTITVTTPEDSCKEPLIMEKFKSTMSVDEWEKMVCAPKVMKKGPPSQEKLLSIADRQKDIMNLSTWEDTVDGL